ncbi:cAMP-activated global transcriptional regulator CRP [Methylomagnum sp.]
MLNHIPAKHDDPMPWLLPHCHRHRFPAKATIIKPGDPGDTLYYITEGSCSVTMHNKETNQDIVLAYLNKGDFIGEMGIFMGPATRDVFVRAREPSQLAAITYVRLHQLLNAELAPYAVGILTALGRQLSHRLLETSRKVRSFAFLDASGRIANALKDLAKQPDAMTHPDGMQIRVTRQEIGRIVGCSREMAGRVLKNLEEKGHIHIKGKTIVVFGTR